MIPSTRIRISSVSRAIESVIIPALGDDQPFALEQARLLLGHLAVLQVQDPWSAQFERLDNLLLREFARDLEGAAHGGPATTSAVGQLRSLLAEPVPLTLPEVRAAHSALGAAIRDVIRAVGEDGGDETFRTTALITIRHERAAADRYRAYFAAMGYEGPDSPLPDLPDLISGMQDSLERSG
ncbi:hypothetical protein GIS00_01030 [Nakamurella sp. YIM 132087]|uniref:Uncharacterized protein n=1 Tax=Nakamurella alba TaxID=2665158 RepID=A0A7K1FEJ5_9ACTN|nr:hypothetical protein [Nakamurella alba]MTD12527.1 hypothetical protein [Nakamurella alba]